MTAATKAKAPKSPKESKLPTPPKGKVVKMHISNVVILPDIQPRKDGLDDDNVERCTAVLMAGEEFKDKPVAYGTKECAWLSEGAHRIASYDDYWKQKEIPDAEQLVEIELRPGGEPEARLFALPSNADHLGLPRSQEDTRNVIDKCLKLNPDWSDRKIAEFLHVRDHESVGRRRVKLVANEEIEKTTERQTKSGGTVKVKEKPAKPVAPAPSANGTAEEHAEAPVSFSAKHWRDLPIQGTIEIPGVNEQAVEAWQKKSGSLKVGELFDAIHASEVKLGEFAIAEILAEIAKLDGFDGKKPTPKNLPEPAKTIKAGDVVYSWSGLEAMFLRWGQFPDEIGRAYPKEKIATELEEIRTHLNNALTCAKKLQKKLAA